MKRILFTIFIAFSINAVAQSEISGVLPKAAITIDNEKLNFNGAGLREKIFLDLYVGSLYLKTKSKEANQIINSDESMAITIDIVSSLISSEKMIEAVNDGFNASTNGNTTAIEKEIKEFKSAFSEEIVKGDHYTIAYLKEEGVKVSKNGKHISTIKGMEFKKALFGIWLGKEPADEDLKEGMLGLD